MIVVYHVISLCSIIEYVNMYKKRHVSVIIYPGANYANTSASISGRTVLSFGIGWTKV